MSSQLWYFYTTSGSFLPITQLSLCTAGLTVNHKLMRLLFCLHPEGEIILQFFHIIFQRCCFGSITNPAVTVFHSSQACVCFFMFLFTYSQQYMYISPFYMHSCGCVKMLTFLFLFFLSDNINLWSKTVAQFLHWVLNSLCNNFIFYKVHLNFYELGY